MTYPKISIVTPSFNQGKYLEQTILSIISQGYPNLEYFIFDGGSSDNSVEIIKKYSDLIHFWVSEKDYGQSHAIFKGFKNATGEILTWVNSDDCLENGSLFKIAEIYSKEKADFYVGNARLIDKDGNKKEHLKCNLFDDSFKNLDVFIVQPASFFTKDAYTRFGPLDINLYYSMDMDFWLKIYFSGGKFLKFEETICFFREHLNSKTSDGYDYFVFELINKYKISVSLKAYNISKFFDEKILRILVFNLLSNGSFKKMPLYSIFKFSLFYFGFFNTWKLIILNMFKTIKRRFI